MKSPPASEIPCPGQYLEVAADRKLVFTDAFAGALNRGQGKPYMAAIITFEPEGKKTRYPATVRHWGKEDRAKHE
jgi:uncharacterized protein YndB with AHSA1/START domain